MKTLISIWSVFFLVYGSYSQTPAHYYIGQEELANIHVYTLLETSEGILYAGTDNGLYAYKHNKFEPIPGPPEQKGKSLFSLVCDSNGKVYCCNLSGQIFSVNQNKLQLECTLNRSQLNNKIQMEVDQDNSLLISSRSILRWRNRQLKEIWRDSLSYPCSISKNPYEEAGKVIFGLTQIDGVLWFGLDDTPHYETLFHGDAVLKRQEQIRPENLKENLYFSNHHHLLNFQGQVIDINRQGLIEFQDQHRRSSYYRSIPIQMEAKPISPNELALRGENNGYITLKAHGEDFKLSNIKFPNQFISAICRSSMRSNCLFLGTFGQGVIVIPNDQITDHNLGRDHVKYIMVTPEDSLYLVTDKGMIMKQLMTDIWAFEKILAKPFKLFYNPIKDSRMNSRFLPGLIHDGLIGGQKLGVGAKDIWVVDSNNFFIATNSGLLRYGHLMPKLPWDKNYDKSFIHPSGLQLIMGSVRFRSIAYLAKKKELIVLKNDIVARIMDSGQEEEITYNNKSIQAFDVELYDDLIILGTESYGVLIVKNDSVIKKIDITNGLKDNMALKLRIQDDQLFILTKKGLHVYFLNDGVLQTLDKPKGVPHSSIQDFDLSSQSLLYVAEQKLYEAPLSSIQTRKPQLSLILDSVLMRGQKIDGQKKFSHQDNQFRFYIDYHEILFSDDTEIQYRLIGLEQSWSTHHSINEPIEFKSLPPGKYTLEVKTVYNGQDGKVIRYSFEISLPFWQTTWFYIGLVLLSLLLFYIFYRVYLYWKMKRAISRAQLNASKLTAIQSQMNPHFIFNSLNSIQDQVLKGEKHISYRYISKFADLIRQTLDYSSRDLISFKEEIKLIELYLSLEKNRFKDELEYELVYDHWEHISVPPMLIQPFIENALIHGLLHKESNRQLKVTFELHENHLLCIVEDNGIGRQKAREIKSRQIGQHQSFATGANSQRFEILNSMHTGQYGFEYIDLVNDKGQATGTKVLIRIPAIREY